MSTDETPTLISTDPGEDVSAPSPPIREVPWTKRLTPRLAWLVTWGTKGSLALTDQALFAGAQFALNILLARWLAPAEYGAFAVAYAVYLLATSAHSALIVEPMIVFGSGRYFEKRRSYFGIALRGHWLLTVSGGLLLFLAGATFARFYSQSVAEALCALGIVLPLTLLAELTRRAFYIEMQPGRAAIGGTMYFTSVIVIVLLLHHEQILTPAAAIIGMGVAAALTAAMQLIWLRVSWYHKSGGLFAKDIALEHWKYGRWVLAATFPSWTLLNIYYLVLPAWFGLKAAGELKAMMNLSNPARHILAAFGALVLPLMVRHRERGGLKLMRRTLCSTTAILVAGAACYLVFLWFLRVQIIELLYAGKYLEYSGLPVLLVGLVPLVTACTVTLGAAISAYERPDRVFWANAVASAIAVSLGLWLTKDFGVIGALAGYLASHSALACVLWLLFRRCFPKAPLNPDSMHNTPSGLNAPATQ